MYLLYMVLDTVDPDKLLVCLSIGTESLAAALDTRCRPAALWQPEVSQDTSAHFCERPFILSLRDYTDNYL